ncbi:methyltransferase domain-containing protein [Streptomyces sp. NPDC001904]|uniref:methyltransferase domain-containing protein n=1 Tax=Streptomyces sp. NPDC001904 TaxID=3154531 RepID=UPI003323508C
MLWEPNARSLANTVARHDPAWRFAVSRTPRHLFVPQWWEQAGDGWRLRTDEGSPRAHLAAVYRDSTLVTQVDDHHADDATEGDILTTGTPTSSSTLPSLILSMYRHAAIDDDSRILLTTGTGYGTALACSRLGSAQVTSIDIDARLVDVATTRLATLGMKPRVLQCDITGPELPDQVDRIVSTVSVPSIPASWLQALSPQGRLVTTIAGTGLILTADKTPDGGAHGCIEWDRAGFMRARHGTGYDQLPDGLWKDAENGDGDRQLVSRYPLLYPPDAWDVMSMMELQSPGIEYRRTETDGVRTVWLLHPDGSWARASTDGFLNSPTVQEAGPQQLWSRLERIRDRLNREGALPLYGATVQITPDGATTLSRGNWKHTL